MDDVKDKSRDHTGECDESYEGRDTGRRIVDRVILRAQRGREARKNA